MTTNQGNTPPSQQSRTGQVGPEGSGDEAQPKAGRKMTRLLIGVLVGGVLGALLGYWGQCSSGMCPLTANPYRGAMIGAVMGALVTWPGGT
jgi:hypothetical protein